MTVHGNVFDGEDFDVEPTQGREDWDVLTVRAA
jgi:hypothetical protein